jgi:CO dehydrogenase/acetyl-CoA synthase epsilon subunit
MARIIQKNESRKLYLPSANYSFPNVKNCIVSDYFRNLTFVILQFEYELAVV